MSEGADRAMSSTRFVVVFSLAVVAVVAAFVLHLGLRGRTIALGYELGRARTEEAHLREVKRVLAVEAASYKTPERVEIVARTLLGMEPPSADRIVNLASVETKERSREPAPAPQAVAAEGPSR